MIAFIDCETSGLDANECSLLEIACVVTDDQLSPLSATSWHSVVQYQRSELNAIIAATDPYVVGMHTDNNLWAEILEGGGLPLAQIDYELTAHIQSFRQQPHSIPVGGNSNRLDMNFMDRHLPLLANELSYRMIDVSTVAQLGTLWGDLPLYTKAGGHRALDDTLECIDELRYYRGHLRFQS